MKRRVKLISVFLAILLLVSSAVYAVTTDSAIAFDRKVLARVDANRALEHIRYLSEVIGPRTAGSAQEKAAANYIAGVFKGYGYEVAIQEFPISARTTGQLDLIAPINKSVAVSVAGAVTPAEGVTGKLVYCGLGGSMADFPAEVSGNIAFIERGTYTFAVKAQNAVAAGAAAVVIYNNAAGTFTPNLSTYTSPVAVLGILQADGVAIKSLLDEGEVTAFIKTERVNKSQNVIATRKPANKNKDAGEIVHVTAHYDSVAFAPGANDNASGTAAIMEFARILKAYPIDKEIRFIACGAEEIGLVGSNYYVRNLSADEITRSIANFNLDMVASSHENTTHLWVMTYNGQHNFVSEYSTSAGARLGSSVLLEKAGGSSDHVPFHQAGIPAVCYIWRGPTGTLEPYYHQPQDTIEINISMDRLQEAVNIIGSALYDVLRPGTPNLIKSKIREDASQLFDQELFADALAEDVEE